MPIKLLTKQTPQSTPSVGTPSAKVSIPRLSARKTGASSQQFSGAPKQEKTSFSGADILQPSRSLFGTDVGTTFGRHTPKAAPTTPDLSLLPKFGAPEEETGFFEPAPKLRIRDFLRETPGAVKETGVSIAQSIARSFAATSQGIFNVATGEEGQAFKPKGKIQTAVFGEEPVNFEIIGRETADIIGKGEEVNKTTAIGLGLVMAGLDVTPFGGSKNAIKQSAKTIAKLNKVDDIVKVLKPVIKGDEKIIKNLAEGLAGETDIAKIEKMLTKIKETPVAKNILTPEKELENVTKRFSPDETKAMEEFIDTTRGVGDLSLRQKREIELAGQKVAESFRLDEVTATSKKLADKFDELLSNQRAEIKELKSIRGIKKITAAKKVEPLFAGKVTPVKKLEVDAKKFKTSKEFIDSREKVFHGTTRDFDKFDASKLGESTGNKTAREGFWFTDDISTAKSYSKAENEKIVGELLDAGKRKEAIALEEAIFAEKDPRFLKEVNLTVNNPKTIDVKGAKYNDVSSDINKAIEEAKAAGHDGLIVKNLSDHADFSVYKPATHTLVFDANNIKTDKQLADIFKKAKKSKPLFDSKAISTDSTIARTTRALREPGKEFLKKTEKEIVSKIKKKAPVIKERIKAKKVLTREKLKAQLSKENAVRKAELKGFRQTINKKFAGVKAGKIEAGKAIREVQDDVTNFIKQNIPSSQRGKFLTSIKNTQNPEQAAKLITRVEDEIVRIDQLKQLSKELSVDRQKIGFIRKVGELNQAIVNEVKSEVGIVGPMRNATKKQLDEAIVKLKDRLEFKKARGFKPGVIEKIPVERNGSVVEGSRIVKGSVKKPDFPDSFYKNAIPEKPKRLATISKEIKNTGKEIGKGLDRYVGVISTRLKNIDPSLKGALRKFEFNNLTKQQSRRKKSLPYFKKTSKMNTQDFAEFDLALKNGDAKKINELAKKYDMENELVKVREMLDGLYKEANEVGYDIGYKKDYFPRMVKDTEGFLEYMEKGDDWSILNKAIQEKELSLGRVLDQDEKATLINTMIRGYSGGNITLSNTGAMKARKLDFVDSDLNRFYADSNSSLSSYINQTTDAIEARRFFGKGLNKTDALQDLKMDDTIGAYTAKLIAENKIKPSQEKELRQILQARFGERGTSGVLSVIKNLSYINTMGSPLNAITQLGDLAFPLYKNGLVRTGKGIFKSVTGKNILTKEDLGIEQIAQEFVKSDKVAGAVTKVFKLIGLEKMDTIGKNTFIDSTISKMSSQAKKGDSKLIKELEDVFGKGNTDQVLKDLKSGNISEDVKYLTFNKLLDFQPVALSEVPEKYLSAGNGRVFYTLKTWTIKQFDVFRNEAFQKIASGNKEETIEGTKNMIKLASALIIMNASADKIKDFMMGRETDFDDLMIDNIASLFGINKFTLDTVGREGGGTALAKTIAPAPLTSMADLVSGAFKDIGDSRSVNELRTVKNIPVAGKLYYWWFGRGADYKKKSTKKKKKAPGLPKLPKVGGAGLPKLPKIGL